MCVIQYNNYHNNLHLRIHVYSIVVILHIVENEAKWCQKCRLRKSEMPFFGDHAPNPQDRFPLSPSPTTSKVVMWFRLEIRILST